MLQKSVSMRSRMRLLGATILPTITRGLESLGLRAKERKSLDGLQRILVAYMLSEVRRPAEGVEE